MNRKAVGDRGEALVGERYRENGYRILERNFRTRFGEIDLILEKDSTLVFCEVKTRKWGVAGAAAMAVTPQKQNKLIQAAQGYLMQRKLSDPMTRFDVAEVYYSEGSTEINIIENAFSV